MATISPGRWITNRLLSARREGALFISILAAGIMLAACAPPTVESPISHRPVTGDQLQSELQREQDRLAKVKADADAKAAAEVRTAKAKAEKDIRTIAADGEIADAQRKKQLADVIAAAAVTTETALASATKARTDADAAVASLNSQTDDAFKVLEAATAQRAGFGKVISSLPIVGQAAASIGLGGSDANSLLTLLAGGGAVSWMNKRAKAREDKAWDESAETRQKDLDRHKAEADAAKARADALQAQLLALMTPPPPAKTT